MIDKFFTQRDCDRCNKPLIPYRTTSWFTEETICHNCKKEERELLSKLPEDSKEYENIGQLEYLKLKENYAEQVSKT